MKYQEDLRIEKIRKFQEEEAKKAEEIQKKKEMLETFRKEQAERYTREYEERLKAELETGELSDNSDGEPQQLYCELCKKKFSNSNQFENHENSKKHKQNAAKLLKEVRLPEERPEFIKSPKKLKKQTIKEENRLEIPKNESEDEKEHEEIEEIVFKFVPKMDEEEESDEEYKITVETKAEIILPEKKIGKAKLKRDKKAKKVEETKEPVFEDEIDIRKLGKAKLKRDKKKDQSEFVCRTCSVDYYTRNRLFSHLKESNHAIAR